MLAKILSCWLIGVNSLESVFDADTIGIVIQSPIQPEPNTLNNENSTEISYPLSEPWFPMFNTSTGLNLVQYLKEKLYENEVEAFAQDKALINAAIVEYHKYLTLTKNWVSGDQNNKYVYIPSKLIDFVWHWHILQTYEYHLMCDTQFNGVFLHHRPYFGKEKQSKIYKGRIHKYTKTLIAYKTYFGYSPPTQVWGKVKHSTADCQMHGCDSYMADCDEMHQCDSYMAGECSQMHVCDSFMADCDEMHTCDSYMADCDEMHACDSYVSIQI